jgi:hypothetical protein
MIVAVGYRPGALYHDERLSLAMLEKRRSKLLQTARGLVARMCESKR